MRSKNAFWTIFTQKISTGGYFLPSSSRTRGGWLPSSLQWWYAFGLIGISSSFIIVLELLRERTRRNGYIFFYPELAKLDQRPLAQTFSYRYLPTLLGVLFGILWSVLDQDIKRLEPYFLLSNPNGAQSRKVMGLNYPADFSPFAPVNAFKQRHWSVFLTTTTTLLIIWIITPLQSALFATKVIEVSLDQDFLVKNQFVPLSQQSMGLTVEFLYDAFGTVWLDSPLPAFSTLEYGATPFQRVAAENALETWNINTTIYKTDVECVDGNVRNTTIIDINDGESVVVPLWTHPKLNCSVGLHILRNFNYFRVGLPNPCHSNSTFVGNYKYRTLAQENATDYSEDSEYDAVVFCDVTYHKASASVEYSTSLNGVQNITNIGNFSLLDDHKFNDTAYNQVLGGWDGASTDRFPVYWPPINKARLAQYEPDAEDLTSLPPPASQMVGMIKKNVSEYDRQTFVDGITAAHKAIFAHAVPYLLSNNASTFNTVRGKATKRGDGIVVVDIIAIWLECLFAVVAISTLVICFLTTKRPNNMIGEPSSIAATMSLIYGCDSYREDYDGLDHASDKDMKQMLPSRQLYLGRWNNVVPSYKLDVLGNTATPVKQKILPARSALKRMPWILTFASGGAFFAFLVVLLVLLLLLYELSLKYDGLPLISNATFAQQMLYSYIPTGLSQLVEPMWATILRIYASLQPWFTLMNGPSPSLLTLSAEMTALPPTLLAPIAALFGHWVLALGTTMPLLANFMSVATGALFTQGDALALHNISLTHDFSPLFRPTYTHLDSFGYPDTAMGVYQLYDRAGLEDLDGPEDQFPFAGSISLEDSPVLGVFDHFQTAKNNVTSGRLPAWTTPSHYFLPFAATSNTQTEGMLQAETLGFTGTLNCTELTAGGFFEYNNVTSVSLYNKTAISFNKVVNGTRVSISSYLDYNTDGYNLPTAGRYALEYAPYLQTVSVPSINATEQPDLANLYAYYGQSLLVAGWLRIDSTKNTTQGHHLSCQQQLHSANFRVLVDSTQRVINYTQVTPYQDADNEQYFANQSEIYKFQAAMAVLIQNSSALVHTEAIPTSWITYITSKFTNNTDILDPSKDVPDFDSLYAMYNDVYRRLFAIVLSQNSDRIFTVADSKGQFVGQIVSTKRRVFMSRPMTIVIATILAINLFVVIVVYSLGIKRGARFWRLPMTLQDVIGYLYASTALEDVRGTEEMTSKVREKKLRSTAAMWSFGSEVGPDGVERIGIRRHGFSSAFDHVAYGGGLVGDDGLEEVELIERPKMMNKYHPL